MRTYPICLVGLEHQKCLVVGGNAVAQQKVLDLLRGGAAWVEVVAPDPVPGLRALVDGVRVRHHAREYRTTDLEGALLVIATDGDRALNARIWEDARAYGVLANAVDDPPHCHFFAPAVVRRGDLVVAVSTGGVSPALAARLRERLESEIGEELGRFLELGSRLRPLLQQCLLSPEARRAAWYRLIDSDVLPLLRQGEEEAAWRRALELLGLGLCREVARR